jgi:DNA repair ATPase RecN
MYLISYDLIKETAKLMVNGKPRTYKLRRNEPDDFRSYILVNGQPVYLSTLETLQAHLISTGQNSTVQGLRYR